MLFSGSPGPGRWRDRAAVAALFIGLTALMTWPQPLVLATHASPHYDVFFNMWRLDWIAHALSTSPLDLFNGTQFYPERRVLAFSDAMLVEGVVAAPLLWLGVRPVLVHNLLLLGALAASGAGMFTLARHVTGSVPGGIVAGIVFAFAPYRFDHYMHMELQWAMWMPWAFWALQRTLEGGTLRHGALTGLFVSLQMLSSIYYGVFLAMLLALVGALQLLALDRRQLTAAARALALGAVLAGTVTISYSRPYAAAARRVGMRGTHEVTMFSARPRDYRAATPGNLLYGSERARPERQLFPGIAPLVLALAGLLLVRPPPAVVAYVIGLAVAFELSLGMYGRLYPLLWEHLPILQGLRAPARIAMFSLLFLGVLAAHGYAALAALMRRPIRLVFAVGAAAVVLLEYWTAPLDLARYPNTPPPLYAFLAAQPRGLVVEFPIPQANQLPGDEARYAYMSTFHRMPILNGYSGYYPPSYLRRLERVKDFPDADALAALRAEGARYLVVHANSGFTGKGATRAIDDLVLKHEVPLLGVFEAGAGPAALFRLQ